MVIITGAVVRHGAEYGWERDKKGVRENGERKRGGRIEDTYREEKERRPYEKW